ncbi:MAG TPA: Ig-like domain repeat protein, partial [Pyrinomonadaceae bacterium]
AQQPAAQPKAASAKSAAADGSKGGDEKSKKDGSKGGGVATPRAGMFEVTIGTLPAQDEVTITFQATIAPTLSPAAANSVTNQGTLTADGGISKPSDDPQTTPPAAGEGDDATTTAIDKFEPAIDLASSDATSDQGDSVTFTATLGLGTAPAAPAPTGTVDFVDQTDPNSANWEVLCDDVAISGATAQCATTAVDSGSRTIAAVYSGDGRYDPATDTVTQEVVSCNANPVVTSEADSGAGSLREAITGACADASITFNIADADPDVITLTTAELVIDKNLAILGPGANLLTVQRDTAVGTPAFRVFSVAAGKIVALSNITVANGLQDGSTFPQNAGGGIFNEAMLTLANVEVTGNTAVGGAGGGVFNAPGATLSIINSTFSGNSGSGGGGIFNEGGTLAMRNSTVSGNSSPADGGGIQTNSAQPVTLTNITVTNNRADSDDNASGTGGGIYIQSGTPLIRNSIVADNYRGAGTTTEDDVANGSFDPASFNNLIGTGGSGGLIAGTNGNLVGVTSPGIGALAANGGQTRTHKLLAGSAALDAGNNCVTIAGGCATGDPADAVLTDQRDFGRPVDAADADTTATVDIGAVEMRASVQTFADASIPTDSSHTVTDFNIGGTSNLSVTATSDNQTLVPDANIAVNPGSTPSQRTLVVTPAAGQTGTANITVTVTDISSGDSMSDTFQLTVAALEASVVTITTDNPDPSLTGQAVTVTFTVTGTAGTPTGNVTITASGGAETCTASVAAGQCDITLAAAGNRTLTATYSGDATYSGGTDTEPHAVHPSVTISDATASEASQLATFTVHLSSPSTETVTVNFTTADEPAGPGKAVAGQDYSSTSGNVVFQPGQTLQTIPVPVTNDGAGEADETFLVNLTGATNANVTAPPADNQATGTITEAANAGAILISELRTSGPAGAGDSFVEIYNNSDSAVTVQATDASAGWAIAVSNNGCASDPVVVGVIPNGTMIPARGHYLLAGSAYSLSASATLNLPFTVDPNPDVNVAIFTSSNLGGFSSATRLDAVGFFDGVNGLGGNCDLLREGSPLIAAQGSTSQYSFFRRLSSGRPQDTGRSVDDFTVVSTTPGVAVGFNATPALGAPGPENIASPIQRNDKIKASLIDPMVSSGDSPNSVRKMCADPGVEECDPSRSQFGTFSIRRRWTNTTGENVETLRFRLVNITTGPTPPAGTADLRAINSSDGELAHTTGGSTIELMGTTVEAPTQALGGGFNSTLAAGSVTMAQPLAPGASINLQFLLGVQQPGAYVFFVNVEAGPPPTGVLMSSRQAAPAKEGVNKGTRGGRQ